MKKFMVVLGIAFALIVGAFSVKMVCDDIRSTQEEAIAINKANAEYWNAKAEEWTAFADAMLEYSIENGVY